MWRCTRLPNPGPLGKNDQPVMPRQDTILVTKVGAELAKLKSRLAPPLDGYIDPALGAI